MRLQQPFGLVCVLIIEQPQRTIGKSERDQWMAGMSLAMEQVGIAPEVRESLEAAFFRTADWMRNRQDAD